MVLIETYWNVNISAPPSPPVPPTGINRNILECKYRKFEFFSSSSPILIETYWNVNVKYNQMIMRTMRY